MIDHTNYKTTLTIEVYGNEDTQIRALEEIERGLVKAHTAFLVKGEVDSQTGFVHPPITQSYMLFSKLRMPFRWKIERVRGE